MGRLFASAVINAVALWLTSQINGVLTITSFSGGEPYNGVLTFLALGLFLGLINALLLPIIKVVTLPLYILTLGLWSLVVNGIGLWLLKLISDQIGWGVQIASFWWDAIWAALVLAIINWVVTGVARAVGITAK